MKTIQQNITKNYKINLRKLFNKIKRKLKIKPEILFKWNHLLNLIKNF